MAVVVRLRDGELMVDIETGKSIECRWFGVVGDGSCAKWRGLSVLHLNMGTQGILVRMLGRNALRVLDRGGSKRAGILWGSINYVVVGAISADKKGGGGGHGTSMGKGRSKRSAKVKMRDAGTYKCFSYYISSYFVFSPTQPHCYSTLHFGVESE